VTTATTVTANGLALAGVSAGDYILANPTRNPRRLPSRRLALPAASPPTTKVFGRHHRRHPCDDESDRRAGGSDDVSLGGGVATFSSSTVGNGKTVTVHGPDPRRRTEQRLFPDQSDGNRDANITPFERSAAA